MRHWVRNTLNRRKQDDHFMVIVKANTWEKARGLIIKNYQRAGYTEEEAQELFEDEDILIEVKIEVKK